jgi:hypothetical protein
MLMRISSDGPSTEPPPLPPQVHPSTAQAWSEALSRAAPPPPSHTAPAQSPQQQAANAANIVAAAARESDPVAALHALDQQSPTIEAAILRDPRAQHIIDNAAAWADAPLGRATATPAFSPFAYPLFNGDFSGFNGAVERLDQLTKGINPTLAGEVASRATAGYSVAFPPAMGRDLQVPPGLFFIVQGTQMFMHKIGGDFDTYAKSAALLNTLVTNDGGGMMPAERNNAVANFVKSQGLDGQYHQLVADGTALLTQMKVLNALSPSLSATLRGQVGQLLKRFANEPTARFAITAALQGNPALASPSNSSNLSALFTSGVLGSAGKDFGRELATSYITNTLHSIVDDLDPHALPSVIQVKLALNSFAKEGWLAKLLGVPEDALDKPGKALINLYKIAAHDPSSPDVKEKNITAAEESLNKDLDDAGESFAASTTVGAAFRALGVVFGGIGLFGSVQAAANDPDWQNKFNVLISAAGMAQQTSDFAVARGLVDANSLVGKFGTAEVLGKATWGDFINGFVAISSAIGAVREGFGLGTNQDTGSAIFSGINAVGGFASFIGEAAASAPEWLNPVGIAVMALAIGGQAVWNGIETARQFHALSTDFLHAGGYNSTAAGFLGEQLSGFTGPEGAWPMAFLAKYAQSKGLTPQELQQWVNHLSSDQAQSLLQDLLLVDISSTGDPSKFTNGPQAMAPASPEPSGVQVRFAGPPPYVPINTVSGLDHALDQLLAAEGMSLPRAKD